MASLAQIITISSRRSAVWRECQGHAGLAPLAPGETHCSDCKANPKSRTARRRSARAA